MKTAIVRSCLFVVVLLSAPDAGRAQEAWSAGLAARVDKLFERMDKPTSPGCALAVVRDGRVVYARGYGMANLDHDIAITPSTVFHVASVSKQFTAAAVLLLASDGKLSLDDDVRKHVPELPNFGKPITIRHLMHHTSGLRDQWELLILAGWRYSLDLITDDDVLEAMARQKDLNFAPGTEHLYCNTGYTLLATIVKRVSGMSFRQFAEERVFRPLGMTRTFFRDDHAEIVKGQAYGYVPRGDTFRLGVTNFDTAGATSLHTTVEDLALWDRNFYDARVGGPAFLEAMLKKGTLANSEELSYASGLVHGAYRGLAVVGHDGGDAGYRSDFLRFPTERLSVVCLCNTSSASPTQLTRSVADVVLAGKLQPAPPAPAADDRPVVPLSAAELARCEGLYWRRGTDSYRKLVAKDGSMESVWGQTGTPLEIRRPRAVRGKEHGSPRRGVAGRPPAADRGRSRRDGEAGGVRGRRVVLSDGCTGGRVHRRLPQRGDRSGLPHRGCRGQAGAAPPQGRDRDARTPDQGRLPRVAGHVPVFA